jgi:hypothetical protein
MPFSSAPRARWTVILGLCLCTLGHGGCSYLFVDSPPKHHKELPYFACTTGRGWPVVDTVLGGIYGIAAISAFTQDSADRGSSTGTGAVAAGMAALLLASALSGYKDTADCREATAQLQLRLMRTHPGPGFASDPNTPPAQYDPWVRPIDQPFGTTTPSGHGTVKPQGGPDASPPQPTGER